MNNKDLIPDFPDCEPISVRSITKKITTWGKGLFKENIVVTPINHPEQYDDFYGFGEEQSDATKSN